MARKIELISGINVYDSGIGFPATNNLLCCLPCQEVNVVFQNVHNSSLTITDLSLYYDASLTVSIISINGNPPSFPFTVASNATFTVKLEICRGIGALTPYWKFFFDTVQHGNEDFYYVPMSCVSVDDITSPETIYFVDVLPNTTVTENGSITNNTLAPLSYTIITTNCGGDITGTNLTGTIAVGATIGYTISWSPTTYPENLACTIIIDVAPGCSTTISIQGNTIDYDCDPEGGICCLNVTLNTEQQYINAASNQCEGTALYNKASILERKYIVYDLKWFEPITNGTQIIFNPYLFATNTNAFDPFSPPAVFYGLTYNTSLTNGNAYQMLLTNAGVNANNQKNTDATITFLDPANGIFRITLIFFVVCDRNFLLNNSIFSNKFKYQKSTLNDSLIYNNTFPSVYNQNEYILSYFRVKKGVIAETEFIHSLPFTARFYDSGLYGGVSEFSNPYFTLSRNVGIVTELSTFEQTKITFNITVPTAAYIACDYIIFHLVDETLNDNNLQFIAATDASRSRIQNNAGTGILDNHLKNPSTFTYLGSDVYEASCYINVDLDPTHQYRIFAIVYSRTDVVNTFKSESYRVRSVPEYDCNCQPEITSYWDNYFETRQTDDYRPVGKERIQHRLVLTEGTIPACLTNWGLTISDWRQALTGVKLKIYKRHLYFPADPNQDYATFFEFGSYYSQRNPAFLYGWEDFGLMNVKDSNIDEIHININNVRVLWENTVFSGNVSQCKMDTYMDKYPILGGQASNYITTLNVVNNWIDEDIYFEYEFEFDLSSYFGYFFKFHICRAFMVSAISFENVNSGFPDVITNVNIEGFDPTISSYVPLVGNFISVSQYTWIKLTYEINQPGPLYGWFNFFIETAPFGLPTLVESNAFNSPTGLQNYGLAPIMNGQSYLYQLSSGDVIAEAIIDVSQLQATSYLFCGYWSEMSPPVSCLWLNDHNNEGGSTTYIQMLSPQLDEELAIVFLNVTLNRYLYVRSRNIAFSLPVVGDTYYFHYTFSSPTTRIINIWFSQNGTSGLPTITIPIGETNGVIMFVMPSGPLTPDFWTLRCEGGTNFSAAAVFKIGNENCD